MARIPDEWIERVKTEVLTEELARRAGVELRPVGQELVGRCPIPPHEDSTPSFSINREKNVFKCFGCGVGGTVIDFVKLWRGLDFRAAMEWLLWEFFPSVAQELLGQRRPERRQQTRRSRAPELPCPFDLAPTAEEQTTLNEYADFCAALFRERAEGREYAEKRGLTSSEMASTFRFGYQDRSLGLMLPTNDTKQGREIRERFKALGLLRESGHAHFVGSLVIPTIDLSGNVSGIYGRKTRDDLNSKASPKHLYLPGKDDDVFNEAAFVASSEIVLCESRIDALSFWQHDFRNVTACRGAGNFSPALLEAFVRHGIERCFIAFDRDEAGDKGALKAAEKLRGAGIECFRVQLPRGMDANEVSLKMTPARKHLDLFLRSAEWMGNGGGPRGGAALPRATQDTHAPEPASAPTSGTREAPSSAASAASEEVPASPEAAASGPSEATEGGGSGRATEERISSALVNGNGSKPAPGAAPTSPVDRFAQGEAHSDAVLRISEARGVAQVPSPDAETTLSASPPPAPTSPAPASPPPASAPAPIVGLVHTTDDEALFAFEDRRYRVFGLAKCHSLSALPVTLKAKREGVDFAPPCPIAGWHMDKLDLCAAPQRDRFEKRTAHELGVREEVVRRDLGLVLGGLEKLQEERVRKLLEPKTKVPEMTDQERQEALDFWKSPDLLTKILEHFKACGLVGEETNKLVCYIAAVSRLLDRPLAIIIQSSSAAGKTALMDALLALLPEEGFEKYTAVSGKSLFYFDEETSLRHKVLAIVEEEGAEKATYPLKILYSEGELRMASTGKDPASGRLVTHIYRVEGPVVIILTTTSYELDPELENRCLRLTVDESREQTRLIHDLQRKRLTLDGLIAQKRKAKIRQLHQNAQRLLRPLKVLNPYEPYLTFVDDQTRTRRDHEKYLTIIEALTLMHQHQRPIVVHDVDGEPTECVKVTLDDIEIANRLAGEVLGRTLDELQPQTRRFLEVLYEKVKEICEREGVEQSDVYLTRKQIRELTQWGGDTQVKLHLGRLIDLEYVLPHRAARGNGTVYELLYRGEGKRGEKFVLGLVDVEKLRAMEARNGGELPVTQAPRPSPLPPAAPRQAPTSTPIPTPAPSPTMALGPATTPNRSGFSEDRSGFFEGRSGVGRPLVGPRSGGGRTPEIAPRSAPAADLRDSEVSKAENSHLGHGQGTRPSKPVSGRTRVNGLPRLRLLVNLLNHPPMTVQAAQLEPREPSEDQARRYALRRAMGRA